MIKLLKLPIKVSFELARLFRNITDLVEGIVAELNHKVYHSPLHAV